MAEKPERDPLTGAKFISHDWDGIRELDNPPPRWWLYTFYSSMVVAAAMWLLYPSFPWGYGYLPGLLGYNERADYVRRLRRGQGDAVAVDRPHRRAGCGGNPARPGADPVRYCRRREGVQDQLRGMPWVGWRRPGLLPDPGRR